ncbi:hypothetical protein VTO42DRAFT_3733 [Malbranchea cinnamomea]
MSSHYNTEPPPTASATLHTTVGPIHLSLFAKQTPLACKNFLQHCLDGYYTNTTFHRVVPNFVVQAGDPTGTGSGGSSIYEDPEFELDYSRDPAGEKVVFKDEIHSRLRFNRRGLVGMAKSEDGSYGSQFFITLAPAERELTGTCTLFGRVEGESIYNVVKIAEAELVEGTERPVYAVRITGCEVGELGPFEGKLRKREKVVAVSQEEQEQRQRAAAKKKKMMMMMKKGKPGKALLSFGADIEELEDDGALVVAPAKPKFNTKLVAGDDIPAKPRPEKENEKEDKKQIAERRDSIRSSTTRRSEGPSKTARKRSRSPEPPTSPRPINYKPPRDPNTQLPLPDPESPARSPSPSSSLSSPSSPRSAKQSSTLSRTNAEIAALKASMRRSTTTAPAEPPRKKSALEAMIPETSIRGRKRPPPGSSVSSSATPAVGSGANGFGSTGSAQEDEALRMFHAFREKLEKVDVAQPRPSAKSTKQSTPKSQTEAKNRGENNGQEKEEQEEEQVCDLHFIANCQSCKAWDAPAEGGNDEDDDINDPSWMSHRLTFAKDTLGKDLNWKREHEDADGLVVIDPREREKEIFGGRKRERERKRKLETSGGREWDQRGRKGR